MEPSVKKQTTAEEIWRKYQQGQDYGRLSGRFDNSEKCWRFYEGDHWGGLTDDGAPLPMYNFTTPVIDFKTAKIAMNTKTITLSVRGENEKEFIETVNRQIKEAWEFGDMENECWDLTQEALVSGHSVVFFPNGGFFDQSKGELCRCNDRRIFAQVLDGCQVFLGNENNTKLQNQPYIILQERLLTDEIKKTAEKNGLSEEEINKILPDKRNDSDVTTGQKKEMEAAGGFTTSLIYFERREDSIWFCRATKDVIYQPFENLKTDYYPMVDYVVRRQKGKARGIGEVLRMIPNQIEVNKTVFRRSVSNKTTAFPKLIYNRRIVENPEDLSKVGANIAVDDINAGDVKQAIDYLQPGGTGNEVANYTVEMLSTTKELAGAGDAALGNINPEQASGAAITAVRDQADIPMNKNIAAYSKMIEDIAIVWYHMIIAHNQTGYKCDSGKTVGAKEMKAICPKIKVDVSSGLPDTVAARVNSVYALLDANHITFDEFLDLVPPEANLPTEEIKRLRKEAQEKQNEMMNQKAAAIQAETQAAELDGMMNGGGAEAFAGMMGG